MAREFSTWIPIFETGIWTDSKGNTRNWTEKSLDEIVNSYDPAYHEAPVIIGPQNESAPAYAWVKALKRKGTTIYAALKAVIPEFIEMVGKGLFKKRRISLGRDIKPGVLYLNYIAYLGAVPPAVKGLQDITLSQGGPVISLEEVIDFEKEEQIELGKDIAKRA